MSDPFIKVLGGGASGEVHLCGGRAKKGGWEDSKSDIENESRIYHRLLETFGAHKRFLVLRAYDSNLATIWFDVMPNGTLRDYCRQHPDVAIQQRAAWVVAMTEGLHMLHQASIIHSDFGPRNMLLDHDLELKIADFAGSSIDGSRPTAFGDSRFYPSESCTCTILDDIFAAGSSIYETLTGKAPFQSVPADQVLQQWLREFPDLSDIQSQAGPTMADIITDCFGSSCTGQRRTPGPRVHHPSGIFPRTAKEQTIVRWLSPLCQTGHLCMSGRNS